MGNKQKHKAYMSTQQTQLGNLCLGAALNIVLSYDLIRQIKEVAASFGNNCKGAYANLVPPQTILNCCRMKFPCTAATMLTTILNNTIYRLNTGHILSVRTYKKNALRRILRTGQGNYAPRLYGSQSLTHSCGPS